VTGSVLCAQFRGWHPKDLWADRPHDRAEAVRPALEAIGGTIVAAGYPFGGYGAVILLEVPDDTTATGIGLASAQDFIRPATSAIPASAI
jgi:uncharacterized protein with GYD domain